MSNFISDKWLARPATFESRYQECLDDALSNNHSTNATDCHLQNAVARLVAIELKLNPRLLSLDSNPDTFARIGYQVALLVQDEINRCAKFYEEAA